jgi:Ca2+/Na+ antiporter
MEYLKSVLSITFQKYDVDGTAQLEKGEIKVFLSDFHEMVTDEQLDVLFAKYDKDKDGSISIDEFVLACYSIITGTLDTTATTVAPTSAADKAERGLVSSAREVLLDDAGEEEEEVPEDIALLSPEKQEAAIKKKAFTMLAIGTFLVLLFSDPMVDVMQEIAVRVDISPFYVSFVLAPLASNASEVLASQFYAAKKTTKTITVAFAALEGAAAMNNTFCLSIFMGLIFFRGLAWQYTAETTAIVLVQAIIYFMTKKESMSALDGLKIIAVFPLSIVLISTLEAFGFD